MKMVISNKKAVQNTKISFQERQFTAQEEKRVSDLERKVSELSYMTRSRFPQSGYSYGYHQERRSSDRYSSRDRPYDRRDSSYTRRDRYSPLASRSSTNNFKDRYKNPFYVNDQCGGGRRPSRSPSNSRGGSFGERASLSRENSPRRYLSPGRCPAPPDMFREGYRTPSPDYTRYRTNRPE